MAIKMLKGINPQSFDTRLDKFIVAVTTNDGITRAVQSEFHRDTAEYSAHILAAHDFKNGHIKSVSQYGVYPVEDVVYVTKEELECSDG